MARGLRILLTAASPAECRAVLSGFGRDRRTVSVGDRVALASNAELLCTGVGPGPAGAFGAGALAKNAPDAVLCVGVGGAYPSSGLSIGQAVVADRSVFADHGVRRGEDLIDLDDMGYPPMPAGWDRGDARLVESLRSIGTLGAIATVAACSGDDEAASRLERRSGALAEAMEGASLALASAAAGVPFAEVRVISNIVGDRARHPWRLDEALARLAELSPELVILASRALQSENGGSVVHRPPPK